MPKPVPTFPADATMFFCIGAQKAGTSWLHDLLKQSPDCHFSPNKELHYFDVISAADTGALEMRIRLLREMVGKLEAQTGPVNRRALQVTREIAHLMTIYTGGGKGADRHKPYIDYLLQGRTTQKVVCDITPSYATMTRLEFAEMAMIGKARFLFVLREPVARMWSQIRMATVARKLPEEEFAAGCRAHAERLIDSGRLPRVERADYARTVAELERAVPAERILYVFYEDLFRQDTVNRICGFLGVAPPEVKSMQRVNEGRSLPIPDDIATTFRTAFARQYEFAEARFGAAVPAAWRRAMSADAVPVDAGPDRL